MTILVYIIGGMVALLVALQVLTIMRSKRIRGKRIEGVKGEMGRAIASGNRVLAYFYSPTCSACRAQTPIIDRLHTQFSNVYKINVAKDYPTARVFGVLATPSIVLINGGIVQEFLIGAKSEQTLRNYLQ